MSLATDERYTPPDILDLVRQVGPIALDPCAPAHNPTGAVRFYTVAQNGLEQPWDTGELGVVWVNPPYSRGELPRWVDKIITEAQLSPNTDILALTPGDMGTRWAQALYRSAQVIAFLHGRLAFVRPDGTYDTGAKTSSAVWYFGRREARFVRTFSTVANIGYL